MQGFAHVTTPQATGEQAEQGLQDFRSTDELVAPANQGGATTRHVVEPPLATCFAGEEPQNPRELRDAVRKTVEVLVACQGLHGRASVGEDHGAASARG